MPLLLGGSSALAWSPPVVAPATVVAPIRRVHQSLPAPTLVDGRPVDWTATETVEPWVDYLRVVVDGVDVTEFRGARTIIGSTQHLDPYGDGPADLTFPGIFEFEKPGEGALSWLRKTAKVTINRVVDGVVVDAADPYYEGMLTRDSFSSNPATVSVEGLFMARHARRMFQPDVIFNPARTLLDWLTREYGKGAGRQVVGDEPGPLIRSRGDRSSTRLQRIDYLLGLAVEEDGDSWTLMPDRSVGRNIMRLQKRAMKETPDWTVFAGAHGVKLGDFAADMASNRVYGEGVAPNGGRWRNAKYPNAGYDDDMTPYPFMGGDSFGLGTTDAGTDTGDGISVLTRRLWALGLLDGDDAGTPDFDAEVVAAVNDFRKSLGLSQTGTVTESLWDQLWGTGFNQQSFQGAFFDVLAADPRTVRYLRGPGGSIVALNPAYDSSVEPVEEFQAYGENVTKRQGKRNAAGIVARAEVRVGTLTLTSDPAEMSRFDIKAGTTGFIGHLFGDGVKVYVSSAERSGDTVTLAIADSPLHFVELATIRQRQIEARQNPAKRARMALRRSSQVADIAIGWEAEGPSGVIPVKTIPGDTWSVLQVAAGEFGTIAETRMVADANCAFMAVVMGRKPNMTIFNRKLGNPFEWAGSGSDQITTFMDNDAYLRQLYTATPYGSPDLPGGYFPKVHTNERGKVTSFSPTGVLFDDATYEFATTAGMLWLAVYPQTSTKFHGRFKLQVES